MTNVDANHREITKLKSAISGSFKAFHDYSNVFRTAKSVVFIWTQAADRMHGSATNNARIQCDVESE